MDPDSAVVSLSLDSTSSRTACWDNDIVSSPRMTSGTRVARTENRPTRAVRITRACLLPDTTPRTRTSTPPAVKWLPKSSWSDSPAEGCGYIDDQPRGQRYPRMTEKMSSNSRIDRIEHGAPALACPRRGHRDD